MFVHGEPTWSFLWRKVIPPVLDAGFRCIAPDLAGFGRSDKPTELEWYSYDRHTKHLIDLFETLDLRDATVVVHDWGGPIGLRVAVELSDHIERIVTMDTGLFTGRQPMSESWQRFREFVEATEDLPIGFLVSGACARPTNQVVIDAYDAPFPNTASKAGARAFPLMVPLEPSSPTGLAGQVVSDALKEDAREVLTLWADADPMLPLETGRRVAKSFGWPEPTVIENAGHFLQEDQGEQIGQLIADWLSGK